MKKKGAFFRGQEDVDDHSRDDDNGQEDRRAIVRNVEEDADNDE